VSDSNETNWTAVAARAQAYQALHLAGLSEAPLLVKTGFLMTLGLARAEAAVLVGSTDESVRVAMSRAKKKAAPQPSNGGTGATDA